MPPGAMKPVEILPMSENVTLLAVYPKVPCACCSAPDWTFCSSWKRYMPKPPRSTVLPVPKMSHAMPTRGLKNRKRPFDPERGIEGSILCQSTPVSLLTSAGLLLYFDGSKMATPTPVVSFQGPKWSNRMPYSKVNRRETFQESWA